MTTDPGIPRRSARVYAGPQPTPRWAEATCKPDLRRIVVRCRALLAAVVAGIGCVVALQVFAAPVAVLAAVAVGGATAWILLLLERSTGGRRGPA